MNQLVSQSLYEFFLNENVSKAKQILKKHNLDTSDDRYKDLFGILQKNLGLIGKFTEWAIEGDQSIDDLKEAYSRFLELKNKNLSLPKTIDEYKTLEEFNDDMFKISKTQTISQLYKQIPTSVKKLINNKIEKLIMSDVKNSKHYIEFFGNKGRSYKTADSLYDALKDKMKELNGPWNAYSYEQYFSSFDKKNTEVVYVSDDKNVMVVDVRSYNAANKAMKDGYVPREWCINREKSSWDNYVQTGFTKQYFVFDFRKPVEDPLAKIGATISGSNNSIKEAQDASGHPMKNPLKYFEKELGL